MSLLRRDFTRAELRISADCLRVPDEKLGLSTYYLARRKLESRGGSYRSHVSALPAPWRFIVVLTEIDMQVRNGGFHQFFTNARGSYDVHLADDISCVPHSKYQDVLHRALKIYKSLDYAAHWANIGRSWQGFAEGYRDGRFRGEDAEYCAIEPAIPEVLGAHVRANVHEYS